jgi:hypothetical protein
MPILTQDELKKLAPIGLYAACAHGGSVLAMGAPGAGKKKNEKSDTVCTDAYEHS